MKHKKNAILTSVLIIEILRKKKKVMLYNLELLS